MPALVHTHTYEKMRNPAYYRCRDPHCSHTQHRDLLLEKAALCNTCATEFILNKYDLKLAKPVCKNCSQTKEAKAFRAAKAITEGMFNDTERTEDTSAL